MSFFTFLILIFIGCGNPPQPFSKKVDSNYSNVSLAEKQRILNFIVKLNTKSPFFTKGDGCIYFNDVWYHFQYWNKFKNCFIIENNKIIRVDKSKCSNDYGRHFGSYCNYIGGRSDKYSNFINNFQKNLPSEFEKNLKLYSVLKKKWIELDKKRKEKASKIKITIVDKTGLVPSNIIKHIKTKMYLPEEYYLEEYFNLITLGNKNDNFPICVEIDGICSTCPYFIERYKLKFSRNDVCKPYQDFPENYKFFIRSVYFNFLPLHFVAKNHDLKVVVDNKMKVIKIYNDSNQFVEVNSIVLYYGDKVKNIDEGKQNIPPKSFIAKKIFFPLEYFVKLVNKNQTHNYGVSISYRKINENIIKTLFQTKKFSVKDFE